MLLNNLSRVAAVTLPTMDLGDMQRALVVAAGTFTLPSGDRPEPVLHEEQPPPPLADDYWGDPASSSLRREGQTTFARPGTDVYLRGHVWAPRRQACAQTDLVIRVAGYEKHARVIGDRVWVRTLAEVRASSPVPFVRMPIVWERSFGGTPTRLGRRSVAVADRNPVGRGLFEHGADADGQPLPNFEDPRSLLSQLSDRPVPVGFGPIARHWYPRRDFAGTYDQAWLDRRAPLWPPDLDPRFFCAAAPGLSTSGYLQGGEIVELLGIHPEGAVRFAIPRLTLVAKFIYRSNPAKPERQALTLDGVEIDSDAWSLTLFWRGSSLPPRGRDLSELELVTLRELEPWEQC